MESWKIDFNMEVYDLVAFLTSTSSVF